MYEDIATNEIIIKNELEYANNLMIKLQNKKIEYLYVLYEFNKLSHFVDAICTQYTSNSPKVSDEYELRTLIKHNIMPFIKYRFKNSIKRKINGLIKREIGSYTKEEVDIFLEQKLYQFIEERMQSILKGIPRFINKTLKNPIIEKNNDVLM